MMFGITNRRRATAFAALAITSALALSACSGGGGEAEEVSDEPVTLNLSFWGNDVRAALYDEAIAAFNEEYPNITVNTTFLGFPEYWEKRQIEATGGGLPDVMQFDYSYMRQYSENGLLLDLDDYLGDGIETEGLSDEILGIGKLDDVTYGIPTSTNAWALYQNPKLLASVGVEPYPGGGTYDDYDAWMAEVTDAATAAGVEIYGGTDYTGRIQNFELELRSQGRALFDDEGQPDFDEDDLRDFWERGDALRSESTPPIIGAQRIEEVYPLSGFDAGLTASELTWDNFGAAYLGNLGADYTELIISEPPTNSGDEADLYLKPSMLHTISANTEHPAESVALVDFLVNSPEAGAAFGTNRGLPASQTQLEGADLGVLDEQIKAHEEAISDRLGDAPSLPIAGFGNIEEKFRQLGSDLGLGVVTVDEAVDQFFSEMDLAINQ
jgi:multiple sugar transport system substrate-binding protein